MPSETPFLFIRTDPCPLHAAREWRPLGWFLWIALVLLGLALFFPVYVIGASVLLFLASSAVGLVAALLLLRKVWRDNTRPETILRCWQPTLTEGLWVCGVVICRWLPMAGIAVLLFGAHGVIVYGLQCLTVYGIDYLNAGVRGTAEEALELKSTLESGFLGMLIPEGVSGRLGSVQAGALSTSRVISDVLSVLLWWFVIEGWLSVGLLVWAAVRTQLHWFARTVVSLPPSPTKRPSAVTFDKGFFT